MPQREKPARVTFDLAGKSTTVIFPTSFSNGDIAATIKNLQSQGGFGEQASEGGLLKSVLDFRVLPSVGAVTGGLIGGAAGGIGAIPGAGIGAAAGSSLQSLTRSLSGIDPPLTSGEAALDIGANTAAEVATDLAMIPFAGGLKKGAEFIGKRFARQVPPEARAAEETLRTIAEEIGMDIGLTPGLATSNGLLDILENVGEGAFFGGKLVRFKDMTQQQLRSFADDFLRTYFQRGVASDAELGRQLSRHIGTKSAFGKGGGGTFNVKQVAIGAARNQVVKDIELAGANRLRIGELLTENESFLRRMLKDSDVVDPFKSSGIIDVPGTARPALPGPRGGPIGEQTRGVILGEFGPPTISMSDAINKLRPRISREVRALSKARDRGTDLFQARSILSKLDTEINLQIIEKAGQQEGKKLVRSLNQINRLFRGSFQRFDSDFIHKAVATALRGDPQKFWGEFLKDGAEDRIQMLKKAVFNPTQKGKPTGNEIWKLFQISTLQGFIDDALAKGGQKIWGDALRETLFGAGETASKGLGKKVLATAYDPAMVKWFDDFTNALQISQRAPETGVGGAAIQFAQIAQIALMAGSVGVAAGNVAGFSNETVNKGALFTAGLVVLGPIAIARLATHPTGRKLLIDGVLAKSPVIASRIAARLMLINNALFAAEEHLLNEILPQRPEPPALTMATSPATTMSLGATAPGLPGVPRDITEGTPETTIEVRKLGVQ